MKGNKSTLLVVLTILFILGTVYREKMKGVVERWRSDRIPLDRTLRGKKTGKLSFPKIAILDSGLDLAIAAREGVDFFPESLVKFNLLRVSKAEMSDELPHGTGLFLQLAARENGFGIIGLIPEAEILPIRLGSQDEFKNATLPEERVFRAFEILKEEKIRLAGMSLSNQDTLWNRKLFVNKLKEFENDFLLVVASGNDGFTLGYEECPYIPTCLNAPNLIKVGASDYPASNRGSVVDVWVTSRSYLWTRTEGEFELRESRSTSAAVPKVVAFGALLMAEEPGLSPTEIKSRLMTAKY